jgi:cysteinyl-tRNA synthetase
MGLCRYFAEFHPEVRITAVEPFLGHKLQGLKNMKESYVPGIFNKKLPFQIINIPDEEAFTSVRLLARKEGIFAGMSSGAAMSAALTRAAQMKEGVLVAIFPDGGEKYLSTELFSKQEAEDSSETELRFFNTLSRKKEVFHPMDPEAVTFYACGPTAHELAHLAHCRRFIVADLIHRVLALTGYKVKFYMNFTDLDDNTIQGAARHQESLAGFTDRYIKEFKQDMASLEVLEAAGYPRASEHVEAMIVLAKKLVDKGFAYVKHGSIYFDISKFARYGRLSGVDLSKIQVGKTVDLDDYEKENPVDFTLLKRSTLSELKSGVFFETEWGNMRPGWHIECAAMTQHLLGETMDIHTSGRDLLFPHHENENAIAESLTGKPLANFWLHSELLLVEGKKMSADHQNLITLRDVLARGYTGRELRYFLIRTHYRKPINFSFRSLEAARKNLRRLDGFVGKLLCLPPGLPHPEVAAYLSDMESRFFAAINDDLNVSKAFAALFDFVKKTNPILSQAFLDQEQKDYILEALVRVNSVLGIMRLEECALAPEIDQLIRDREEARKQKDWPKADGVRQELAKQGIEVLDTAKGPVWKEVTKKE